MIEAGLTRSRRAVKVGIESDPGELRVFVPSCESVFHGSECAQSGYPAYNQFSEMQTKVSGSGTLIFYWKISGETNEDYLRFYVDGVLQGNAITGATSWAQKSVTITGDGNHTLVWRYTRGSTSVLHDNRGYVDYLQWSGAGPIEEEEEEPEWQTVSYTYDPAGRRIEKKVDGTTEVKYVYDGDHILAEYNGSGTLLRKYVHGPDVDKPISMIESAGTYAGTYYYHYDALGSVVALTNSAANVVELYEYSVYGQVAASDANHPNRFMFTGREFDTDTGLYYYRARYCNPGIGRFLQSDPVYGGMNWYAYCGNDPVGRLDASGCVDSSSSAWSRYLDTYWWWFTFEFPTAVVGDKVTDDNMSDLTHSYFNNTGFFIECPGWMIVDVAWGGAGTSGGSSVKVTFGYYRTNAPDEVRPMTPSLMVRTADVFAGPDGDGATVGTYSYIEVTANNHSVGLIMSRIG